MTEEVILERGCYHDSARLMAVARALRAVSGVIDAEVMMGTAMNRALLADAGFPRDELAAARPMDLVIAVRADSVEAVGAVRTRLATLLSGRDVSSTKDDGTSGSENLPDALAAHPEAGLVSIAVPGVYAAFVAHRALDAGRSVLLFSNNVAIADEVALKRRAVEAGLLLMGPDCGTAILAGVGLGFANRVPRGTVGIVGASGTGTQEVSCILARAGVGISHAIGTGSRDLTHEVGGLMTESGVGLLAADEMTRVVVVVAKHPHAEVAARLHRVFADLGKPVIVRYLGEAGRGVIDGVVYAGSLDVAAAAAVALDRGEAWRPAEVKSVPTGPSPESGLSTVIGPPHGSGRSAVTGPPSVTGRLVGLFGGGSLAAEAAHILACHGLSTSTPEAALRAGRPLPGDGHLIVDTGDDVYTVGRPHPMVDQTVRCDLIRATGGDAGVGIVLLDLVLGDGAHPDPAPEIAGAVDRARRGRTTPLAVVCSVCGTTADPQGLHRQEQVLREAGIEVTATAAQAAILASRLLGAGAGRMA
jgi:succinyl-CoA synthetase alpha subunit